MNRQDIVSALSSQPWAIHGPAMERLIARDWPADPMADAGPDAVEAMYAARGNGRAGTVAVVPILGTITKRDSLLTLLTGGTSTTRLTAQLRQLAADESVATVLLNVDSPGGSVSGLPEAAAEIRRTRETKRVVAIANPVAASAAYWLAAQAEEVIVTPEAMVGSIGAFLLHLDLSQAMAEMGITPTFIQAGRRKTDGHPFLPLSEGGRGEMQSLVDDAMRLFVADVAAGRGVPASEVRSEAWGEGAVLTAKDAVKAGMVDRIATYSETVARLSGVKPMGARADAAAWEDALSDPATRGALDRGLAEVAAGETVTLGFDGTAGDEPETSTSGATAVITGPLPRTRVWRGRSRRR